MEKVLLWGPAPVVAGRHEWKLVVFQNGWDQSRPMFGPFISYEWRAIGETGWQDMRQWPGYDINKGTTFGLPAVTRKLYAMHGATARQVIENRKRVLGMAAERALDSATEPTPEGLQYVIPGCEKDRMRGPAQLDLF